MSDQAPALVGGSALLERAIGYTLGSLNLVTAERMTWPTPCAEWDLRALLGHMDDSLTALYEAAELGYVDPHPPGTAEVSAASAVPALRNRACRLLGAWAQAEERALISIAGCPLTLRVVAGAGALEVAVHGWDVAWACGRDRPIPAEFAEELLQVAPLVVGPADRPVRFAPPVETDPRADPGSQLVAFLGRSPE